MDAECRFYARELELSDSSIEWTNFTWNPVAGCSIVSEGCRNCYAMRMAARLDAMRIPKYEGLTRKSGGRHKWTGQVRLDFDSLLIPSRIRSPKKIFVNSMSDLFHEAVPDEFVKRIWSVMQAASQHQYQILTKRPERASRAVRALGLPVLNNVWVGTSVEDADALDRLDHLRSVPAAVHFVSFEPLIGSVRGVNLTNVDWAIIGGESGPGARPMLATWVDEIYEACLLSGTAFFFKQWGGVNKKATGRRYRDRTWDDFPAALSM